MTDYFCATCGYTDLDQHGRCSKCGSENVAYQVTRSLLQVPLPEKEASPQAS